MKIAIVFLIVALSCFVPTTKACSGNKVSKEQLSVMASVYVQLCVTMQNIKKGPVDECALRMVVGQVSLILDLMAGSCGCSRGDALTLLMANMKLDVEVDLSVMKQALLVVDIELFLSLNLNLVVVVDGLHSAITITMEKVIGGDVLVLAIQGVLNVTVAGLGITVKEVVSAINRLLIVTTYRLVLIINNLGDILSVGCQTPMGKLLGLSAGVLGLTSGILGGDLHILKV